MDFAGLGETGCCCCHCHKHIPFICLPFAHVCATATVNQGTCEKMLFFISRPFFTQFKTHPIGSWHSAGGSRELKEKRNILFAIGIQCRPSADAMVSVCGSSQLTLFEGWLNNSSEWIALY